MREAVSILKDPQGLLCFFWPRFVPHRRRQAKACDPDTKFGGPVEEQQPKEAFEFSTKLDTHCQQLRRIVHFIFALLFPGTYVEKGKGVQGML